MPLCDTGSDGEKLDTSSANFCISLDRGYGHVEGQRQLAEMGIYSNSMMVTNRVGLPRKYLKELATDLANFGQVKARSGKWINCDLRLDAPNCRKFSFTALHKAAPDPSQKGAAGAVWELSMWQDSQLIVSMSNFFSTSRCGVISRGSSKSANSYSVWVPEAIWHYNLLGRSATDGCDQLRKKMCLAERKIQRVGVKGICFVFDIAFTNAAIMWNFLNRNTVSSRAKLERDYSKV